MGKLFTECSDAEKGEMLDKIKRHCDEYAYGEDEDRRHAVDEYFEEKEDTVIDFENDEEEVQYREIVKYIKEKKLNAEYPQLLKDLDENDLVINYDSDDDVPPPPHESDDPIPQILKQEKANRATFIISKIFDSEEGTKGLKAVREACQAQGWSIKKFLEVCDEYESWADLYLAADPSQDCSEIENSTFTLMYNKCQKFATEPAASARPVRQPSQHAIQRRNAAAAAAAVAVPALTESQGDTPTEYNPSNEFNDLNVKYEKVSPEHQKRYRDALMRITSDSNSSHMVDAVLAAQTSKGLEKIAESAEDGSQIKKSADDFLKARQAKQRNSNFTKDEQKMIMAHYVENWPSGKRPKSKSERTELKRTASVEAFRKRAEGSLKALLHNEQGKFPFEKLRDNDLFIDYDEDGKPAFIYSHGESKKGNIYKRPYEIGDTGKEKRIDLSSEQVSMDKGYRGIERGKVHLKYISIEGLEVLASHYKNLSRTRVINRQRRIKYQYIQKELTKRYNDFFNDPLEDKSSLPEAQKEAHLKRFHRLFSKLTPNLQEKLIKRQTVDGLSKYSQYLTQLNIPETDNPHKYVKNASETRENEVEKWGKTKKGYMTDKDYVKEYLQAHKELIKIDGAYEGHTHDFTIASINKDNMEVTIKLPKGQGINSREESFNIAGRNDWKGLLEKAKKYAKDSRAAKKTKIKKNELVIEEKVDQVGFDKEKAQKFITSLVNLNLADQKALLSKQERYGLQTLAAVATKLNNETPQNQRHSVNAHQLACKAAIEASKNREKALDFHYEGMMSEKEGKFEKTKHLDSDIEKAAKKAYQSKKKKKLGARTQMKKYRTKVAEAYARKLADKNKTVNGETPKRVEKKYNRINKAFSTGNVKSVSISAKKGTFTRNKDYEEAFDIVVHYKKGSSDRINSTEFAYGDLKDEARRLAIDEQLVESAKQGKSTASVMDSAAKGRNDAKLLEPLSNRSLKGT